MSELQISLIALGILIILGVVFYNWWQERRIRRNLQKHLPVVEDDPLLSSTDQNAQTGRREPGLAHLGLQSSESTPDAAQEPVVQTEPLTTDEPVVQPDALIEEIIELVFSAAKSGETLLAFLKNVEPFGNKPVRFFMLAQDGTLSTNIHPQTQYMGVHLAVLLANRAGPLTAIDWSQIWGQASALAEELEARLEGPDQNDVLAKAVALDNTCAALDMQIGLNLLLGKSRRTEDIVRSATGMGFVQTGGGLVWMGEHEMESFTLGRFDGQAFEAGVALEKLSLVLDVPRSPATDSPFARMIDVATELARRLGATVVDDQGQPLASGAAIAIDERLAEVYTQIEAAGLQAGSERARRVFS